MNAPKPTQTGRISGKIQQEAFELFLNKDNVFAKVLDCSKNPRRPVVS